MENKVVQAILSISRIQKRIIALAVDMLICVGTVITAFYLRLGVWAWPLGSQWAAVAASVIFAIPLFITFGLYRAIFRYAGWGALVAITRAVLTYGLIYSMVFTFVGVVSVPRTVGLIQPILLLVAVGIARASVRYWLGGGYESLWRWNQRPRVLIYGAGSAGHQLLAAMANSPEMKVVGFIDDDQALHGSILNGRRIYASDDLSTLLSTLAISNVLLAIPSASRKRRNEILAKFVGTGVGIRTVPGVADLAQGRVTMSDLRELDIDDLLGRDTVAPDQILLGKNVVGKSVLVTGAGGSIGSELCRQILALHPAELLLVDMSEYALYSVHQELERILAKLPETGTRLVPLLGSVTDETRINAIMKVWKPNTVYHAAAYKHVPLVEHNPAEGIRNNVFGTYVATRAAQTHGVQDFVLISTDKAVRPTSIMGASKRLAEMILQAAAARGAKTCFSIVRFGNVLGSSGSVVPLFRKQISDGGPITITHPEVTRYFMTIPEAAQLVIQASAMAVGGEVFVLDMGEPVKIIDLARKLIELSGLKVKDAHAPDGDMEIAVVGLRPGEKLYEELLIGNDPSATIHPRIMKASEHFLPWAILCAELGILSNCVAANNVPQIRDKLRLLIPEYQTDEGIVDWVHMASGEDLASSVGCVA